MLRKVLSLIIMFLTACDMGGGESFEYLSYREDVTNTNDAKLNEWSRPKDDIDLDRRQAQAEKAGTTLDHLLTNLTPDTAASETSDAAAPDEDTILEEMFVETIPCTEDWHCAAGKECTSDGLCTTKLVLISTITGYDGSHPPVYDHTGEEVTLWYGREQWTEVGQIPYMRWLPLAELCESGIEIDLRNPADEEYSYGGGCVSDFKNLTLYLFTTRLTYSVYQSQDEALCPTRLHIARDHLPCE